MIQEDENLLLQDLCARLQYNVQILADINKTFEGGVIGTLKVINLKKDWVELQSVLTPFKFDEIRPYLRPMSSVTEEEEKELIDHFCNHRYAQYFDVCNKYHIDYRGLIEKGLAIEVTKDNNPYKD